MERADRRPPQASAFNACCDVYAPRYRQANGKAFVEPNAEGEQAIELAYSDVARAFDAFLARNAGRPFILASHSQGTVLATRLLRERIVGQEPGERLIAAYLIGGPVRSDTLDEGIPLCEVPAQTRCVVAWNARGEAYEWSGLEFRNPSDGPEVDPMADRLCVNPLTWNSDEVPAAARQNTGALFFDAPQPRVLEAFASARCRSGTLIVSEIGDPPRDLPSKILDWMMGPENYHPIEYQLYYTSIRHNALERTKAAVTGGTRRAPRSGSTSGR